MTTHITKRDFYELVAMQNTVSNMNTVVSYLSEETQNLIGWDNLRALSLDLNILTGAYLRQVEASES